MESAQEVLTSYFYLLQTRHSLQKCSQKQKKNNYMTVLAGSFDSDSVTEAGINVRGLRGRPTASAATLRGKWVSVSVL